MKKLLSIVLIFLVTTAACAIPACAPGRDMAHSRYDIFVIYDEDNGTLSGNVEFDYYNSTENEISDLKFNLYGNAFRDGALFKPVSAAYQSRAYYAGVNFGGMEITNVENCAGWNVGGEDQNVLTVNLSAPVYPEQRTTITISYKLTLAKINHRTGISQTAVNLGNFYPILCAYSSEGFIECPYYTYGDPFLSECADYRVTVDMPEGYVAASSGKLESQSVTDGRCKASYSLYGARDFALVLSDKFKVISREVNGTALNYYYVTDASPEGSVTAAAESFDYFCKTFGEYVYPTLSVVQTGFCYGGMEYPALTMIADGGTAEENIYTIVHENAHQWWYAMVGSNQLNCAWQDEGLAEYSTLMFFESQPKYGYTRAGITGSAIRAYRAFFSVFKQLNGEVDTSMSRNLSTFTGEFEYNNVTYNKGLILFDTLRDSIGDEKFTSCLKKYFAENLGKIATEEGMIAAFTASGTDVEGLFNSFTQGKILI